MRTRKVRRPASSIREPTRAVKAASRRTSRAGRRWVAAVIVVSSTKRGGIAWVSAASVAMRAAEMSGLGETRSNGRQSQRREGEDRHPRREEGQRLAHRRQPLVVARDMDDPPAGAVGLVEKQAGVEAFGRAADGDACLWETWACT
jgi:hypothetical protein